ncbi:amidohydrolase family protein [Microbacterium sp. A588]
MADGERARAMISCVIHAEVDGSPDQRVVLRDGVIEEISSAAHSPRGMTVFDARGGALIPGLWDHHTHVRSAAARRRSIEVGDVRDRDELFARMHHHQRAGTSLRLVGYDSDRIGQLTLDDLESGMPGAPPSRIQHRSGHHWVLNASARAQLASLGYSVPLDGILWDHDDALAGLPSILTDDDVRDEFRQMRAQGIVHAADLTATNGVNDAAALSSAAAGAVSLDLFGMPDAALDGVKLLVHDHLGITPDEIGDAIALAAGAPVALHIVTDAALALGLAACASNTSGASIRFEHAFICPPDAIPEVAKSGATVGAHPGFLVTQGDRLIRALSERERGSYQPLRSLIGAGVSLFGGTDAPFGTPQIWKAMQAAVDRRTPGGGEIGADEALTPEQAIALFSRAGLRGDAAAPTVSVGDTSVCILDRPWAIARSALADTQVAAVLGS